MHPKRKGHPATWAAFSLRENSSNGVLIHQNFLPEVYESEKQGVKQNLRLKYSYFQ
jgi:hypothetical protein